MLAEKLARTAISRPMTERSLCYYTVRSRSALVFFFETTTIYRVGNKQEAEVIVKLNNTFVYIYSVV